jgi:Fe-S cluster assembly iron-binding protein IscA
MRCQLKVALVILTALLCPAVSLATVSVSISPSTVQVQPGGQAQFNAVVSGTNSVVVWSLTGVNCSGVACGQISSRGLYQAPPTAPSPNVVTVTATVLSDLSVTASAAAIIGSSSDVKVTVSPAAGTVLIGQQQQFVSFVSGTTITGVTWHLSGASCSGSGCGTISAAGVYTAPATVPTPAQVTVTATSSADPSKSGSSVVTVALPVAVNVSPTSVTLNTGMQKQFTATVANTTNTAVTWSVAGNGCSGASCGAITSTGLYTAPSSVPSPPQVFVTATSAADPTKSSTVSVTIIPPVAVTVSPTTAQILTGGHQQFTATVTNTTNTAIDWSVAGSGCSGSGCGTVTSSGFYTAPATVPTPARVFVTATSAADPTKSSTASVTIIPPVAISISPTTAQVVIGTNQQFTASVTNTTNTAVTWAVAGNGCSGTACGTVSTAGLYTAPGSVPTPGQVRVTATSVADPTKTSTATLTIVLPVAVTISPKTVQLITGATQQFSASVANTTNTGVTWTVAGTGCTGAACGTISTSGLYTAPSAVPSPAEVFVTVTSVADPTKSSTASVTISLPVGVTVSPGSATVPLAGHQQFTATVANTTNTAVTWSISGSGCSGASCGTITTAGLYTAPASVPSPAQVTVRATSIADPTRSGSAFVTVSLPVTVGVSPISATVTAGTQKQFTATVANTSNTAVTWSVSGSGCSGATCGVVSSTGLYTAPSTVPSPATVSLKATSVSDPTKSDTASITIVPPVSVTVSPAAVQVITGAKQQFTATVKNATNTAVTWSVGGSCGGAACGTITSSGLYTAPAAVPNPALVVVTATSVGDPTRTGTASVTIIPPVAVTISPTTANVGISASLQFLATVSGTSNTAVTWSVSGSGCTGATCGKITSSGFYTAPATVPNPAKVTVTVTSVADSTKFNTATVTIIKAVSVSISPTATPVATGAAQQFTATVTGNSNTAVTWSITGGGCSGAACGKISTGGLYTAPPAVPNPALVSVTATSVVDPTKSATAAVTIVPPVGVTISPTTATVMAGGRQQFLASVNGTTNNSVTWSVSGSGCSGSACGVLSSTGLYTAPTTIPTPAQVTVKVASVVDPTKFATATVTLAPPVAVKISPTTAEVAAAGGTQQFTATVTGSTNTSVTWVVTGTGCTGASCGTVSPTGRYTAPSTVPNPANVAVTATSAADKSKSASATVTIIPPVAVRVSPATIQVVSGGHQQFTATVTGSQDTGVTWSLSGSGCSGSNCGSITSTGLYSAPGTIPNPAHVKVTATSDADSTKSGSATVTVIAPVVVTISPTSATVAIGGQQQFQTRVTGSTNTAVDWSVSGAGCSGSGCGTISSTGLYKAPASVPATPTVIVKASSQIDVSQSASATVSIVANLDAKLDGEYAFQFTGFDSNGVYEAAGSFTADGAGNISAGLEDVNNTGGPATSVPFTGTYLVSGDNRGVLTLSSAMGTQVFRFALDVTGAKARLIEFDASGIRGSGEFERQDPSTFDVSLLKGAYVLRLAGTDSLNARIGALGIFDFDGAGNILGGSLDVNDGGTLSPTFASFKGIYRVDSTGRGIANLSIPGFAGGSFRFAFYVVSASKLLFISTDQLSPNNPLFGGPAELQSGAPFLTSVLSGSTVFSLSGEEANTPQIILGGIWFDGVSQPFVHFDQNTGGTVTNNALTGAYAVGVNGPGTLNLDDSNGHSRVWYIYTIGANHAFMMDASSANVGMGELNPQTVEAPFSNADILGTYLIGSGEPLVSTATLVSGVSGFDGKKAMGGTEDISRSSGLAAGQSLSGAYSVSNSVSAGRGTLILTSPSGETFALWVTSDAEVLGLEIDSSNAQPVLLYFEQ